MKYCFTLLILAIFSFTNAYYTHRSTLAKERLNAKIKDEFPEILAITSPGGHDDLRETLDDILELPLKNYALNELLILDRLKGFVVHNKYSQDLESNLLTPLLPPPKYKQAGEIDNPSKIYNFMGILADRYVDLLKEEVFLSDQVKSKPFDASDPYGFEHSYRSRMENALKLLIREGQLHMAEEAVTASKVTTSTALPDDCQDEGNEEKTTTSDDDNAWRLIYPKKIVSLANAYHGPGHNRTPEKERLNAKIKKEFPEVLAITSPDSHNNLRETLDDIFEGLSTYIPADVSFKMLILNEVKGYVLYKDGNDPLLELKPNILAPLLPPPRYEQAGQHHQANIKIMTDIYDVMFNLARRYQDLLKEQGEDKEIHVVPIAQVEDEGNEDLHKPLEVYLGVLGKRSGSSNNLTGIAGIIVQIKADY
ncbi:hypothetical protein Ddc_16803 [Ditylenchus destructor]|nr:hypothetical protein Ddc_16803 [Ditylenchus destructor]